LRRKTFSLIGFYQRRVRRIVPALLVVLAVCAIFGWLTLLPTELQWLGSSTSWCAAFLANIYFARIGGNYFGQSAELYPLLHLWSLGVEEQFYLVWPILVTRAVKNRVTVVVLIAVIVTSLAISIWGAWYAPRPHVYLPGSRAWELAVGGLLAAWQLGACFRSEADSLPSRSSARLSAQLCSVAGLALEHVHLRAGFARERASFLDEMLLGPETHSSALPR
jgi:peptidoglycan/LPS O-acetylase OafA/YrhL